MKSKLLVLCAVVLLGACSKTATESRTAVGEFKVDRLFTIDGCTVYRFSDAGYLRYFTNCKGNVSSQYTMQSGKTTHVHVDDIPTEVK